jgi:hypothetical protein
MFGVPFSPNAQLPASLRHGGTVRLWHIHIHKSMRDPMR